MQREISSLKPPKGDLTEQKRRTYTKDFVRKIVTILNTTRAMAKGTAEACEIMDFTKLLQYSEDLSSAAQAAVKETQTFVDLEFAPLKGHMNGNIEDEAEYFEQKYKSVEFAAVKLKQTLTRFSFLSPLVNLSSLDMTQNHLYRRSNSLCENELMQNSVLQNVGKKILRNKDISLTNRSDKICRNHMYMEAPI